MRASRLISLLSLLQARGQLSTTELAAELEVSPRTILRDIEALNGAGIPVYATRGRLGGFQLLDGFTSELPGSGRRPATSGTARNGMAGQAGRLPADRAQRALIRLSPRGRRLAALLGRPEGLRLRRGAPPVPGRAGWVEAWARIGSADAAVLDMLALGAEVEVISPAELRAQVAHTARQIADLHASPAGAGRAESGPVPGGLSQDRSWAG